MTKLNNPSTLLFMNYNLTIKTVIYLLPVESNRLCLMVYHCTYKVLNVVTHCNINKYNIFKLVMVMSGSVYSHIMCIFYNKFIVYIYIYICHRHIVRLGYIVRLF